jgi:lipoprotein-anchoring transpeptidase ErfK/SrfK
VKRNGIVIAVAVVVIIGIFWVLKKPGTDQASQGGTSSNAQALYMEAQKLVQEGQRLQAQERLQRIISEHPDFDQIENIQQELYGLNLDILLSNIETPKTVLHEVQPGDSLGKIAKQYSTTVELIQRSNNLAGDVIRVGQKLRIWTGKFTIYVDKSQNVLMLKSDGDIIKVYYVSTGTNNSTPVGTFKITTKLVDPVWFKSGAVIPPESPDNVLGSRWMGFDLPGYGIHGTVEPDKIGQQATAGCVRMRNAEVEELYTLVPMGTEVTVVD